MANTVVFTMKIDAELKSRIEAAAARDRRSTASLIAVVMDRWLEGNGYELDPDSIKAQPLPGRPRVSRDQDKTTHHLSPAIVPWLDERETVTIDEVLEGPLKSSREKAQPALVASIKGFFHEFGWRETYIRSGDGTNISAWIKG